MPSLLTMAQLWLLSSAQLIVLLLVFIPFGSLAPCAPASVPSGAEAVSIWHELVANVSDARLAVCRTRDALNLSMGTR